MRNNKSSLSGLSRKLKRITVLILKEPLAGILYVLTEPEGHSYSIVCPYLWLQLCHSEFGNKINKPFSGQF